MISNCTTAYSDSYMAYDLNRHGFRCAEFEHIRWDQCIVLLGCSQTFGVAIPQSDTLSSALASVLSVPVINLGVPGASNGSMERITRDMVGLGLKPALVITAWTNPERLHWDQGDSRWVTWSASTEKDARSDVGRAWRWWVRDPDRVMHSNRRWRQHTLDLWARAGVPVIEYSTQSRRMASLAGQTWHLDFDHTRSRALDGAHYDGDYNRLLAGILCEQYPLLNTISSAIRRHSHEHTTQIDPGSRTRANNSGWTKQSSSGDHQD